jgi:cell wall-associated NlpC family hydrolase
LGFSPGVATFVNYFVFIIVVVSLCTCKSSRHAIDDYSNHRIPSNNETAANSPKQTSKKDTRTGRISDGNSGDESTRLTGNLIREANKLIGVDYRYGGTSPSRGFDCSGFTSYVFGKLNIEIPRTSTDQSRAGKRKKIKDADVGDLVFFGTGNRITHVGIAVARTRDRLEIIHSTSSSGVRRDEIFGSPYWNSRVLWAIDLNSLKAR